MGEHELTAEDITEAAELMLKPIGDPVIGVSDLATAVQIISNGGVVCVSPDVFDTLWNSGLYGEILTLGFGSPRICRVGGVEVHVDRNAPAGTMYALGLTKMSRHG